MRVRSKLALTTAFGLLALLFIFYLGGRLIVVRTFRRVEREVVKTIPCMRQTLRFELSHLDALAAERAAAIETAALLEPREVGTAAVLPGSNVLIRADLHLYLLATPDGRVAAAQLRDRKTGGLIRPSQTLSEIVAAGSRLLAVTNPATPSVSGLTVLEEGPMLVAARPVTDPRRPSQIRGILVLGRYFQDRGVLSRVAAVLPGFGVSGAVPELQVRPASRRRPAEDHTDSILNDVVEVTGLGQWRGDTGIEVWLPVYDLNGRPALSLVIALPHSFSSLAETALAWLTLFVAVTGILFVVPLLLVQGRTVLDPLTRMADWLRQSETAALPGRRMAWHRQDEFGTVAACIDRMLDTMERTHQSVVESEQRMRALVEANPDLFFVFDSRGEILDTSIRHTESPLLPSDAVAGRNIRNVEGIQPELATRLLEHLAAALDTDRIQVFEYSLLKPDGRMFWGEARVVRIRDDRAMVIVRDITEQRHAERERLRLEEKMQQVQKLEGLGVLAGGIAHDFNNILAAMVGHTEQAQTLLPAGAPAREAVESIRRAAMRASGLTRQLLAYAGQGTFKFRLIDVNVILSDMSELLRTTLSKKAALEVHLEQGLPLVEGDSSQVWQVVMNLLTNASDALGDQPGRIDLGTRFLRADEAALAEYMGFGALTAGDYVEVTVRDTGRGMDAQTIERIFDPFFTTKAAGRGLGLSAVLGIVRAHRGGIVVKSELGAGTTVRVVLPAARSPDGQLLRELRRPAKSSSKTTVQGSERRRVLLAEDEIDIRKLTVLVLNSIGCEVVAAANGREAVDLFAAQPQKFDLVLMDVEMPELNGEEALRAIRAIRLNVPAIVMSGYGDAVTRQRFDALAPAAYLQKPFAREDLVAVVAEIGRSPA